MVACGLSCSSGPHTELEPGWSSYRLAYDLVVNDIVRTGAWDFSGIIEMARNDDHPESQWLEPLAEVLGVRSEVETLGAWPAPTKAGHKTDSRSAPRERW